MRKIVHSLSGYLLLTMVFYCVYPYLLGYVEFSHDDIVYNYAPFRAWFLKAIREHHMFPLWDPFSGLGRFAEMWTVLPLDILSPIGIKADLPFAQLFSIQILIVFFAVWWGLRSLRFKPALALVGAACFLLAPATSYFLFYYIHSWPYVLYALCFCFLFRFLTTHLRRHLLLTVVSVLLFAIGGKAELVFYTISSVSLAGLFFVLQTKQKHSLKHLLMAWAALAAPLLLHSWYFNLILVSTSASLRIKEGGVNFNDLFDSLSAPTFDLPLMALYFSLCVLFLKSRILRRKRGKTLFIGLSVTSVVLGFYLAYPDCLLNVYLWGYATGISLAFFLSNKQKDPRGFTTGLLMSQVLLYYFGRPLPGELAEVEILHGVLPCFKFAITFLAAFGMLMKPTDTLSRWSYTSIVTVFGMRSVGLIFLSHLLGVLWLPARDNFLIDLPVAIFATIGTRKIMQLLFVGVRKMARRHQTVAAATRLIYGVPLCLALLFLLSNPRMGMPPTLNPHLLSDVISESQGYWRAEMRKEKRGTPVRILSYFHSMGRGWIADTREYNSLVTARYARYSLSQRLGVPLASVADVGNITAALSEYYRKYIRRVYRIGEELLSWMHQPDFYLNYLVKAVPPLDCHQLRLLGIRYIEAEDGHYHNPNMLALNRLYSKTGFSGEKLSPDVGKKIKACGFERVRIHDRSFWKVKDPLPRAVFIPMATKEALSAERLSGLRIESSGITFSDGKSLGWFPAGFSYYMPNRVIIEVNAEKDGVLVFTDLYDSRWRVHDNGQSAALFPALFLFRGVYLTKGIHHVEFDLPYPRLAMVIGSSLLGLLLLSIIFLSAMRAGLRPPRAC